MSPLGPSLFEQLWWLWWLLGCVAFVAVLQTPVVARLDRLHPAVACAIGAAAGIAAGFAGARYGLFPAIVVGLAGGAAALRIAGISRKAPAPLEWPSLTSGRSRPDRTDAAPPPSQTSSSRETL